MPTRSNCRDDSARSRQDKGAARRRDFAHSRDAAVVRRDETPRRPRAHRERGNREAVARVEQSKALTKRPGRCWRTNFGSSDWFFRRPQCPDGKILPPLEVWVKFVISAIMLASLLSGLAGAILGFFGSLYIQGRSAKETRRAAGRALLAELVGN